MSFVIVINFEPLDQTTLTQPLSLFPNEIMPTRRDRRLSYDPAPKLARKPRPRWMLHIQAQIWRYLMSIGMFLHKLAPPRPSRPYFSRSIPSTIADIPGFIPLRFYVPPSWHAARKLNNTEDGPKFPVVVNFHGGGFTLGRATDDARWCNTVVSEVGAIVVSVDYRLAPEHPFPTAVQDGADALLYLIDHADELCIDVERIAVSGFSSGANMCFTVPLRFLEELMEEAAEGEMRRDSVILAQRPALLKAMSRGRTLMNVPKQIAVKAVVAWYPPVDYTRTRAERKATASRIDQQLPQVFTDLFDESYLQPPTMNMGDPYLSPGVAPRHLLAGLPEEIIIFACEWDMLVDETEKFVDRLRNELGKTVNYNVVEGVPHGFDKAPNPIRQPANVMVEYRKACQQLKRLLA
jgi:acetyl esterase/lipase